MELLFLGTAASEGFPNVFCACANCAAARREGGPSLRKRSAVLLDGELLIDLGPDLMAAGIAHGVDLHAVRYLLQTHEHADHLEPSHLLSRSTGCGVHGAPHLELYASPTALAWAAHLLRPDLPPGMTLADAEVGRRLNLTVHPLLPFQRFTAGPYEVLSLAANHGREILPLLFAITRAGRRLLYATDTGELPASTWQALVEDGRPFHTIVMDHTFGFQGRDGGHLNAEQFQEQAARLGALGLLAPDAQIYATHLGHHSHPAHSALAAYAAGRGYAIAYDGLRVTV